MIKVKDIWRRSGGTWLDAAALAATLGYIGFRVVKIHQSPITQFTGIYGVDLDGRQFTRMIPKFEPFLNWMPYILAVWLLFRMMGPVWRELEPSRRAEIGVTPLSAFVYLRRRLAGQLCWALMPAVLIAALSIYTFWCNVRLFNESMFGEEKIWTGYTYMIFESIRNTYIEFWGALLAFIAFAHAGLALMLWRGCRKRNAMAAALAPGITGLSMIAVYGAMYAFWHWAVNEFIIHRTLALLLIFGVLIVIGWALTVYFFRTACRNFYILD